MEGVFFLNFKLQQMDSGKLSYNIDNIFGSTSTSVNLLAQAQGCLIYVSGSFIVFYSPKLDEQVAYLRHSSSLITAIAVSDDERIMAVADRAKPPSVSVYAIQNLEALRGGAEKPMYILRGHKHSVDLLAFSPNNKYILSLSNHDGSMFLWEKGECLTKNRVSKTVARAVFDKNGDLVTVGRGYLKVWKFNGGQVSRRKEEDCWIMEGRVLTFGKTFSSKDFVELVFYGQKILLLSSDGMLCIMAANYEKVEKWIDLVMPKAVGLKVVGNLAICGGDNALIKSVDLDTLTLRHKFPKPPPPSKQNLNEQEELAYGEEQEFPACQAILQVSDFIVTLYSSRTIFIWQLGQEPCAIRSIISHRAAVHSLSLLQEVKGDICFFGSSSEDGTVRLWHFYKKQFEGEKRSIDVAQAIGIKRNVYCRNLTRIIYTDSQLPIIRIRLYQGKAIACISSQEFLLYSLQNFQLLLLHNFEDEQGKHASRFLSLDTHEDVVYLGDEAGKLRLYRPQGESLVKLREFTLDMPIQSLQVFSKRILVCGKSRLKCLTLEGETLLNQYNVQCAVGFGNNVIYCDKNTAVIYNLTRSRKSGSVSLAHQLDNNETIRMARSNSWLIIMLTTKNKLIITNFSCAVLYSQQLSQAITDMAVTEGGQLLLATESGSVVVRRQESNRYVRIDEKVKKWFQMNDMSWMDGSVWASSKNRSHSLSNQQLQGVQHQNSIHIDNQNSIRLEDESVFKSIGMIPPRSDLAVSYKNDQNKRSIFNPGQICAQANQIYQNVTNIMKNRGGVSSPKNEHAPDKSKSLRNRIFKAKDEQQKSQYVPVFSNNLVQSVIGDCPPSAISKNTVINNSSAINNNNSSIVGNSIINKSNINKSTLSKNEKEVVSTDNADCVTKSKAEEESINFGFIQFEEPSRGSLQPQQFNYTQTKNHHNSSEFLASVDLVMKNYDQIQDNREYVHSMLLDHYDDYQKLYKILNVQFGRKQQEQWAKATKEKFQKLAQGFLSELQK